MLLLAAEMLPNAVTEQLHLHLLVPKPPIFFMCKKIKDCGYMQLNTTLDRTEYCWRTQIFEFGSWRNVGGAQCSVVK